MKLVFAVDYNDGTVRAQSGDEVSGLPPHRIGVLRRARVIVAAPDPLDHDGDGQPGGSPKGINSTASKGARRRSAATK